jgi:hypothetical protein
MGEMMATSARMGTPPHTQRFPTLAVNSGEDFWGKPAIRQSSGGEDTPPKFGLEDMEPENAWAKLFKSVLKPVTQEKEDGNPFLELEKHDGNPFLELEMSVDFALKLRGWAEDNYETRVIKHGYRGTGLNKKLEMKTMVGHWINFAPELANQLCLPIASENISANETKSLCYVRAMWPEYEC